MNTLLILPLLFGIPGCVFSNHGLACHRGKLRSNRSCPDLTRFTTYIDVRRLTSRPSKLGSASPPRVLFVPDLLSITLFLYTLLRSPNLAFSGCYYSPITTVLEKKGDDSSGKGSLLARYSLLFSVPVIPFFFSAEEICFEI